MMINRTNAHFGAANIQKANAAPAAQENKAQEAVAGQNASQDDSVQLSAPQVGAFNLSALVAETADEAAAIAKELPEHVENEVIVKLKPEFAFAATEGAESASTSFANQYGAEMKHKFDFPESIFQSIGGEMIHLKLPEGVSTAEAMAVMAKDGRVEYAVQNDVIKLTTDMAGTNAATAILDASAPDNLNPKLWGINNEGQTGGKVDADVDAPEAWGIQAGKTQAEGGPLIAIIDTGINYNHEAIKPNLWTNPNEVGDGKDTDGNGVVDDIHGYNAINNTGDPLDDNDHGSHCAGSIAANGDNSAGLYGVSQKANLMGVKFLNARGGGNLADAIKSIEYATKMGARVTSNSWGGGGFNQALYDAFKASPAMHIIAAGNENNNNDARPSYPANFDLPNVISVAATDHKDGLASFSNYGKNTVHIGAPGVNILSSTSGGDKEYKSFSGTSMATPHVTGAANLLLSQYPDMTNEELKAALLNTGDSVDSLKNTTSTGKRLNAHAALQEEAARQEEAAS